MVKNDLHENYFAAIADKHKYAQSIQNPKIILAGGSNLAFGISSDSIEKKINRPVVNLGLYVGFGLDFILQETLSEVKKGDLVILSIEYYLKKNEEEYSKQIAAFAYPPAYDYVGYTDWLDYAEKKVVFYSRYTRNLIFFPNRIKSPQIDDETSDYFRKGFSKRGDLLSHLNNTSIRPLNDLATLKKLNYSSEIQAINQFISNVRRKGGKVYWLYPCYSQTGYDLNKDALVYYENQIKKSVNCLKINTLKDGIYPDDCFYDTHFHLFGNCRIERTEKLIQSLSQ
ncbi:MAG: hypothetical protein RLZZ306_536 [Bacteroidota bacterium]|jgi:hypothetical protein